MKKLLLAAAAAVLLSGCASMQKSYDGYNLALLDPYVEINKTTLSELRGYLGTPTLIGKAEDGSKIVAFALVGNREGGAYGRNVGKGMLTLGLGSKTWEATAKSAIFKLDANDVVVDYKKDGWSFLMKHRFTYWIECDRRLSAQELNEPLNYTVDEVCKKYAEHVAATEGIELGQVDIGKEFEWCNLPCHTLRDAQNAFGKLTEVNSLVDELPGDGEKIDLVFPR